MYDKAFIKQKSLININISKIVYDQKWLQKA